MSETTESANEIDPSPPRALTRRGLLLGSGAGAVGLATAASLGLSEAAQGATPKDAEHPRTKKTPKPTGVYKTEPYLIPPTLQITNLGADPSEGPLILAPVVLPTPTPLTPDEAVAANKGQMGLLISDISGEPIFFRSNTGANLIYDFQVQEYNGKPVLTYWEGLAPGGSGDGVCHILNTKYEQIATVKASTGYHADLHEFTITPQNTALISVFHTMNKDLTSVHGPKKGQILNCLVQEIDIATGALLFEWQSIHHVPLTDSYAPYTGGQYDYFHINSIALWDDDTLIISARNTWTLYAVSRSTAAVLWQINGKNSDFAMGPGTNFYWQHHARHLSSGQLTVFDDGALPAEEAFSRGLVLNVDTSAMTVTLDQAFSHPAKLLAGYEGSMELLDNGNAVVCFGDQPYVTEFDPSGNVLLDVRFPTQVQTYRGFRSPWVAQPAARPKIAAEIDGTGGYAVYLSWNGATEVASWRILSGATSGSLSAIVTMPRAGFETAVSITPTGNYVAAQALDGDGNTLGETPTIKI